MKFFRFLRWVCIDIWRRWRSGERPAPYGVWLYIGLPGKGKTISIVDYLERARVRYPRIKILTNFGWLGQDAPIKSWRELVEFSNGADGVIFAIDEIQLTFNSRDWKDFPPEMVSVLTQNRKQRKQLVCSAQSYDRVDKVFRELTNYVIRCNTLLGRWTFNRAWSTPEYEAYRAGYASGRKAITSWKYSFVQSDFLRGRYDTYKQLQALSDSALSGELRTLTEYQSLGGDVILPAPVVVQSDGKRKKRR